MSNDYTFEQLNKLTDTEINAIKHKLIDDLAVIRQKRWNDIAAVLYFQSRIKNEMNLTHSVDFKA